MSQFTAPSSPNTPLLLFDRCSAHSAGPGMSGEALLFENPVGIVRADRLEQVPGAIAQIQTAIDDGLTAAGFFSYELGYALEPSLQALMPGQRDVPLIWFALFPQADVLAGDRLAAFFESKTGEQKTSSLKNIRPALEKADYLRRFEKVKQLIASGDIYQANLTFKLLFEYEGNPLALYQKLREQQPVSYGAYLQTTEFSILSLSPELFFELEGGQIITRPMKGTAKRGMTPDEDAALAQQLQSDAKNRAENLMIVDLMRNDFARICKLGSVEVSDLYRVEQFPTLHQMTSGVRGLLRDDVCLKELIKALIPAGSITGAPKIRAQEIIKELESAPRGVYCGALGVLSRDQGTGHLSALFNVAIRTLTLFADGKGETGIGSGVVQDSVGIDEYEECLLKAKFLAMPEFRLIETMRLDADGSYYLAHQHLERLARSGREFGFLIPVEAINKELCALAKSLDKGCYLVRLLLSTGGRFTLTSAAIDPPDGDKIIGFVISKKRVASSDKLLGHKTTRRQLFDDEWQRANKDQGADEILFLNERDELTEGSRTNLFIERNGELLTPELSSGLLPGTLREELLEQGRAVEARLTLKDLEGATVYFGNSVRGLQPARLI